ncbi:prepilin peptidase [Pedobacter sp.]|uniref:prepilin peptidase n=1 Tax=Pedobacter sp. TaxID=1411316 RepID=UPI00396C52C9
MLSLKLLTGAVLIYMAWQDFKYRAIYVWLFIVSAVLLAVLKYKATSLLNLWGDLKSNIFFLLAQALLISLYFAWKEKRWVNLLKGYFGEGDLLFLVCMALYFSFMNYVLFYLISILLVLIGSVFYTKRSIKIPLAGGQALCMVLVMVIDHCFAGMDLTHDFWLYTYLNF